MLPLHMLMFGEQHCEQEAERIQHTWRAYYADYQELRIEVMCRPDFPVGTNGFSYEVENLE